MIAPSSVAEVQEVVRTHHDDAQPLCISGGNTLRGMGNVTPPGAGLTTTGLNALIAHEAHDLTCAAQAGMRLRDFLHELAACGQFVPLDAPLPAQATIGGTLAAGWLGARRHLYGKARDFVIGCEAVLADGSLARAGGMVVKNVTGYDMNKLYIGSFGTLGILTRLNFKTIPLPQKRRCIIAALPEGVRTRAVAQITSLSSPPAAAFCVEGYRSTIDGEDGIDGRLLIFLEGTLRSTEAATREVRSAIGRAGVPQAAILDAGAAESYERVLGAMIAVLGERSMTYRSLGLPSNTLERATALRDACHTHRLFTEVIGDVLNGDIFLRVSDRDAPGFASKIENCDDDLRRIDPRRVVIAGTARIRAAVEPWGELPAAFPTMLRIKQRFDPKGILNPGRFVGGI